MPAVNTIDSSATGLARATEETIGVLPDPVSFQILEPNDYGTTGGQIETIARDFISDSNQRSKGATVDLVAEISYETDITLENLQAPMEGMLFAATRSKGQAKNALGATTLTFTSTALTSRITIAGSGAPNLSTLFPVGSIVHMEGWNSSTLNSIFVVSANSATTIDLDDPDGSGTAATIPDEGANTAVVITRVGVEASSGDIEVDASGSRPAITSTTLNLLNIGLIVGEPMIVGGDAADTAFDTATNNVLGRVRSIAAGRIEFDKVDQVMADEVGGTKNIHLYFGEVIKNEVGSLVLRKTYQFERTLGASNSDNPNNLQAEYIVGAVSGDAELTLQTADKATMNLGYTALTTELRTSTQNRKTATRVAAAGSKAFNTSSDVYRVKLSLADGGPNATPLFAFVTDLSLSITNNLSRSQAIGVLGAFDIARGTFEVSASMTAYFADIEAISAVTANADVTLDYHVFARNSGFSIDLPLIGLGDARPDITKGEKVTLPITADAAVASSIDPALNHTMLMTIWSYAPTRFQS